MGAAGQNSRREEAIFTCGLQTTKSTRCESAFDISGTPCMAKMCRVSCVPKLAHASSADLLATRHSTSMLSTVARMGNTASRCVGPKWLPDQWCCSLLWENPPPPPEKSSLLSGQEQKTHIYHHVRKCKHRFMINMNI